MIREAQHDVMRWYACGSLLSDVTEWTLGCLTPNMGILVSSSKRCWALLPCYQYFYFNTYDHKHCHCTLGLPCWLFCWRIWKSKLRKAVSNNLKLCTHVCPKHFHWRKYSEYSKEVKSRNCVQCTYVCQNIFARANILTVETDRMAVRRILWRAIFVRLWHLEHHNQNQRDKNKKG